MKTIKLINASQVYNISKYKSYKRDALKLMLTLQKE
jgi:hypothetical protein